MFFIYYKCPKCGAVYYSAAKLSGDQLICEKCGATVEPIEDYQQKESTDEKEKPSK
ncbi:hypothetical protein [Pseudothermotoga thermarum]|uniref:hypothetical protein n=1 Tax=Pseudothermotoga thermarum TaxID=119394 RepID=UPI0012FD0874|nr:hypothetical protein [Pseudothermotoga thermarum]